MFDEALFSEIVFQSKMIEKHKLENWKNQMVSSAFTAWLLGAGSKGQSFNKFLKKYKLVEPEEPLSEDDKKAIVKKALSIAEKIKLSDKKRVIK